VLIDTHCHLGDKQFDGDRAAVIDRARAAGVGHVVVIADCAPATTQAISLANQYGLSATAGVHPHEASSWSAEVSQVIEHALTRPEVVAVGEAGLDYHYDHSPRDVQRSVFAAQLSLAEDCGKPIVVHSREADDDMVAMLRDSGATAILHSFSSGQDVLSLGLQRGDYISFSGMVTFRSWSDGEAVRVVPANRILVETDSPYLAPVPYRGKRNESAFVVHVAAKVAELRGVTVEQLTKETTENAARCFGDRVYLKHTNLP
jgi:TatD DNase family protein